MGKKVPPRKIIDDENDFGCAGGTGILRQEVWVDGNGQIVRYNLAFLLPHLFGADNGRVPGYDNAHGTHERHSMGKVEESDFEEYPTTARRFFRKVRASRDRYEDKK
jgi:hypothetical protein